MGTLIAAFRALMLDVRSVVRSLMGDNGTVPLLVPPAVEASGLRRRIQPALTVQELVVRPWGAAEAPAFLAAYTATSSDGTCGR